MSMSTTILIINLVGVVAGISYAIISDYQSWGLLFGKLSFTFWVIVHLHPLPQGSHGETKPHTNHCCRLGHPPRIDLFPVVGSH
jgi:hypothetical protein